MLETDKKGISWGSISANSYPYGQVIEETGPGMVRLTNPLLPAGQEIKRWYSKSHLTQDKEEALLPILRGQEDYVLFLHARVLPLSGLILEITFYDLLGQELESIRSQQQSIDFTYPIEARSYEIALIAGGFEQIDFDGMEITKRR